MTKQTDRLLVLEIRQKTIYDDVQDIKEMLTDFIKTSQNRRIECGNKITSNSTQTKFQWAVLAVILFSMIAIWMKT